MPGTVTLPLCSRTKASPFWIILLLVSRRDIVCKGLAQERRRGAAGSRSPGSPITGRTVASIDDRARRVSRVGLTALLGRFVLLGALARQPASGASSPGASLPAARPGAPAGVPEWGSQRADEAKPVRVAIGKPDNRRAGPMVNGNPWPPRVFRVVADFDGSSKRYVGHGRPSKIIGLQGVSLASRGLQCSYPLPIHDAKRRCRTQKRSSMRRRSLISANSVRYRRRDKLRSGRTFWRYVDSSPWTRSSRAPTVPGPSPNPRCYSRCGEPSSVVKIRCRTSWDRAPPRQPRISPDGSFAGPSSDEDAQRHGQGIYNLCAFCQTRQSIFQVPLLLPWTRRIGPVAFSWCARPQ